MRFLMSFLSCVKKRHSHNMILFIASEVCFKNNSAFFGVVYRAVIKVFRRWSLRESSRSKIEQFFLQLLCFTHFQTESSRLTLV